MENTNRGVSGRGECTKRILLTLLEQPKGFEDLVKAVGYARGTVSKYLEELYSKSKDVTQESRSGPYCLTVNGKKKATNIKNRQDLNDILDFAEPDEIRDILSILQKSHILGFDSSSFLKDRLPKEIEFPKEDFDFSKDDIAILKKVLGNIATRKRIKKLKKASAPIEIINLGYTIIDGKMSWDSLAFYCYPIDYEDIEPTITTEIFFERILGVFFPALINPKLRAMITERANQLIETPNGHFSEDFLRLLKIWNKEHEIKDK